MHQKSQDGMIECMKIKEMINFADSMIYNRPKYPGDRTGKVRPEDIFTRKLERGFNVGRPVVTIRPKKRQSKPEVIRLMTKGSDQPTKEIADSRHEYDKLRQGTDQVREGMHETPEAKQAEDEAAQMQCEAMEMQDEATRIQHEAIEMQREATQMQCEATEMQCEATRMQREAIEMQREATQMQCEATEMQHEAVEMQDEATQELFRSLNIPVKFEKHKRETGMQPQKHKSFSLKQTIPKIEKVNRQKPTTIK